MYKLDDFMGILEQYAPLELSHKLIEKGDYDNSGIIIKTKDCVNKILFSLDLSVDVVNKAKELDCDTIVTHHPAIYMPIKSLNIDENSKALVLAIKNDINVISMHLNLDIAEQGTDQNLCLGLGGKDIKIIDLIDQKHGYGRLAKIEKCEIENFVNKAKKAFESDKIIFYGNNLVEKIASFCGSGASHAISSIRNKKIDADTIITSDIAHHELMELIENGKNVIIIPHYVSEQYGFNKFYALLSQKTQGKAQTFYFLDNRFM